MERLYKVAAIRGFFIAQKQYSPERLSADGKVERKADVIEVPRLLAQELINGNKAVAVEGDPFARAG